MLSHPRLHSEQKMQGLESFKARILADQEKIEHDFGARFSELMKLPYFDCVRMSHYLFTGTAKHYKKYLTF